MEPKRIGKFGFYRTTAFFGFDSPPQPIRKHLQFLESKETRPQNISKSRSSHHFSALDLSHKSFYDVFSSVPRNRLETSTRASTPISFASLNQSNHNDDEDENIMFVHEADLLRYDRETKEWKEPRVGDTKIIVHKSSSSTARLLMRRQQVLKLCSITKETRFEKVNETTYSFIGQDFDEPGNKSGMWAIKFETAKFAENFLEAVHRAQEKIDVYEDAVENELENDNPKGSGITNSITAANDGGSAIDVGSGDMLQELLESTVIHHEQEKIDTYEDALENENAKVSGVGNDVGSGDMSQESLELTVIHHDQEKVDADGDVLNNELENESQKSFDIDNSITADDGSGDILSKALKLTVEEMMFDSVECFYFVKDFDEM